MNKWWILGHGQVAHALVTRLDERGVAYEQGSARQCIQSPPDAAPSSCTGIVLATTDATIASLAQSVAHLNLPMLHLSGATAIDVIPSGISAAVWWPMQSFHADHIPWGQFPTFIEARDDHAQTLLTQWQQDLGIESGMPTNSDQRRDYHLGAVFANNFSNHIIALYQDFFREKALDREVFDLMLRRTVDRALDHDDAHELQSGPAYRGEADVIKAHRARLPDDLKAIFDALTTSIQKHAK